MHQIKHLVDSPHRHLHHRKRPRAHGHRPGQCRPNPPPKPSHPLRPPRLPKTIPHVLVPLLPAEIVQPGGLRPEPVRLHLALDHVERIARQPQRLAGQAAVQRHLPARDLLARDVVARGVQVHEVLEGEEPDAVGLGFAQQGDGGAAVETVAHAARADQLAHAVGGAVVETLVAVRLGLEADTHVLDGRGEDGVGDAGEGARGVEFGVG